MQIIAEVGSNWKTSEDCIQSIRLAKACGADIVKFQTFTREELFGPQVSEPRTGLRPPLELLTPIAKEIGIELMCTAFSPAGYAYVDQFVGRHKIASSEITDVDLLKAVASLKKPVIISTGGASPAQINQAYAILKECPVTLMHCVVEYPAYTVDFDHLTDLMAFYGKSCTYGYSDHTIDVLHYPLKACLLGCEYLEKHVNFTSHTDTPDAKHALNTARFHMMIRNINGLLKTQETFIPNPHQRRMNADGKYYRPMPDDRK